MERIEIDTLRDPWIYETVVQTNSEKTAYSSKTKNSKDEGISMSFTCPFAT